MTPKGRAVEPFNNTLMGVAKAVLECLGRPVSAPTVYGGSGHAFLINVHREICPSGPYCWHRSGFDRLLSNLGARVSYLGVLGRDSSTAERGAMEAQVRAALDRGQPCSLLNLEHQLITGYDDVGFNTTQPWPSKPGFPPGRLSFGTWSDLGDHVWVSFYSYEAIEPAPRPQTVQESLEYAVDLFRRPAEYEMDDYGIGPDAYVNWIAAAPEHGSSHGNWWNATVWSECRTMASAYFGEIREEFPDVAASAAALAGAYGEIAELLDLVSDRDAASAAKVELLEAAARKEADAVEVVAALSDDLRKRIVVSERDSE